MDVSMERSSVARKVGGGGNKEKMEVGGIFNRTGKERTGRGKEVK